MMRRFRPRYFDCNICVNGPECTVLNIKPESESCPWFKAKNNINYNPSEDIDNYIKLKINKEKKRIISFIYSELSDNNFLSDFSSLELEQLIDTMLTRYYMLYGDINSAIRLVRDRLVYGLQVRCENCEEIFIVNLSDDINTCPFCNKPLNSDKGITILPS